MQLKDRFADPGVCTYCQQRFGTRTMTSDHVPAESWYAPSATPPNEEKPQVPCCRKCNEELGRLEERVFLRLLNGCTNENRLVTELLALAVRSVIPRRARNPRDAAFRLKKLKAFQSSLYVIAPEQAPRLAMGTPIDVVRWHETSRGQARGYRAVFINPADTVALVTKLVRGLYRWERDYLVPLDADIDPRAVPLDRRPEIDRIMGSVPTGRATTRIFGGGSFLYSAIWGKSDGWSEWLFRLWDEISFSARVAPRGALGLALPQVSDFDMATAVPVFPRN